MAKTVTLWFDVDNQADTLIEDMREYPGSAILTPVQEHDVYAIVLPEPDPIARGYWCTNCEFFEDETYAEFSPFCALCGCKSVDHTIVKVVSNGDSSRTA